MTILQEYVWFGKESEKNERRSKEKESKVR